jgi:hypothetical protein
VTSDGSDRRGAELGSAQEQRVARESLGAQGPWASWRDALLLFAAFVLLYALLGQWSWYKIDGQVTILRLAMDGPGHPRHLLADQFMEAFLGLVHPLGLSLYEGVRLASALGIAGAGLVLHRSCALLDMSRGRCAAAQVTLSAAPGAIFYATIVEFHGPYLLLASLAFWGVTRLGTRVQRTSSIGAMLGAFAVGMASGMARMQHGSGQMLPILLLPWLIVLLRARGFSFRASATLLALVAFGHVLVAFGLPPLLRATELIPRIAPLGATDAGAENYLSVAFGAVKAEDFGYLPTVLQYEWLYPFAFASVLVWFRSPGLRNARLALGASTFVYVALTFVILRFDHEFGAYPLPVLLLAALLTARAWPPKLLFALGLISILAATPFLLHHDSQQEGRQLLGSATAADLRDRMILFVATQAEQDAALMALSNRDFCQVYRVEFLLAQPPVVVAQWVQETNALGRPVHATQSAWAQIAASPLHAAVLTAESSGQPLAPWQALQLRTPSAQRR